MPKPTKYIITSLSYFSYKFVCYRYNNTFPTCSLWTLKDIRYGNHCNFTLSKCKFDSSKLSFIVTLMLLLRLSFKCPPLAKIVIALCQSIFFSTDVIPQKILLHVSSEQSSTTGELIIFNNTF